MKDWHQPPLGLRIPMRLKRPAGCKRIVAPDGSEIAANERPTLNARAVRGHTSVSEIGDAENISKSYVSRVLRLALLSPDIIEAILAGRADQSLMLERLERPLPASWEEQRTKLRPADPTAHSRFRSAVATP